MVVFVSGNQRMTSHYAPVRVTAHICKSIGSMNQKIHHTRLQLLLKMYCGLSIYQNNFLEKTENIWGNSWLHYLQSLLPFDPLVSILPDTSQWWCHQTLLQRRQLPLQQASPSRLLTEVSAPVDSGSPLVLQFAQRWACSNALCGSVRFWLNINKQILK